MPMHKVYHETSGLFLGREECQRYGLLTGEDDRAEMVEMALGQPITSREQSPERPLQDGKPHNNVIIAP